MSTTSPIPVSTRCSHRTPSGRRCPKLAADAKSGLCPRHLDAHQQLDNADLRSWLLADWKDFQTAQGINFSLGSLYTLLAANRISARRAAVLAYISSLILRTHSAIDADNEAGVDTSASYSNGPQPIPEPNRDMLPALAAVRAPALPHAEPPLASEPAPDLSQKVS
jgi:hypothetical protein